MSKTTTWKLADAKRELRKVLPPGRFKLESGSTNVYLLKASRKGEDWGRAMAIELDYGCRYGRTESERNCEVFQIRLTSSLSDVSTSTLKIPRDDAGWLRVGSRVTRFIDKVEASIASNRQREQERAQEQKRKDSLLKWMRSKVKGMSEPSYRFDRGVSISVNRYEGDTMTVSYSTQDKARMEQVLAAIKSAGVEPEEVSEE